MKKNGTKQLTLMGMFVAIILVMAFTPIGFIQLPFIKATIVHIPVIIGSIMLGAKYGSILGSLFGLTSMINNTMNPVISSFAFSPFIPLPASDHGSPYALIVCFVPRILVGIVPWLVYTGLKKLLNNKLDALCFTVSGVAGSFTNTLLVMHLIYFFFRDSYAAVRNVAIEAVYNVILSIIAANGIPEAIVAGTFAVAVCVPIRFYQKRFQPT
jgi:uncharacterized membrane protein